MFCIDIAGFLKNDYLHIYLSKLLVKLPTEVIVKLFFGYTLYWQRGVIKF